MHLFVVVSCLSAIYIFYVYDSMILPRVARDTNRKVIYLKSLLLQCCRHKNFKFSINRNGQRTSQMSEETTNERFFAIRVASSVSSAS